MDNVDERAILDLLLLRYTDIRRGTIADRWTRAEHVSSVLGYRHPRRTADFIAADKYPGHDDSRLAFHGHEVKVSRSDWLTELRDPSKSEAFRPFMHHWWLVVADGAIIRDEELPHGWGLMVKAGRRLRVKVPAPRLTPEPMPIALTISLMAAAARTAHRDPLRRDAPTAYVRDWTPRCGFCGEPGPCAAHQPRLVVGEATRTC